MRINEGQVSFHTVRPVDRNGVRFIPGTARYRLDDFTSREAIIAWTSLTPATEMLITIPATSNTILRSGNAREKKVLTVETDEGTSSANTEEEFYWVKNLGFVG